MFLQVSIRGQEVRSARLALTVIFLHPHVTLPYNRNIFPLSTPLQVSIRGHEVRSARLALGQAVAVAPGETVEFEGVGEDYIRWTGGRLGPGFVKVGLSLRNVGLAAKPGERLLFVIWFRDPWIWPTDAVL